MFIRRLIFTSGMLACLSVSAIAQTIGVSLPLSGDFSELGQKFRKGMEMAASDLAPTSRLVFVDDGCDATLAQSATEKLIEANADIVTGFLCSDTAIPSANSLVDEKTPVLVAGARSVRLIKDREREAWNLWRMSPGDDYPVFTAASAIARQWRETPFALVDDGTIYGRNFTDQLRFQLDTLGMKPQFSDSFRAAQSTQAGLLRRLQRSGVTAVLVASATLEDLQTIAIDNARLGTGLEIIATEALMALPFLETAGEVPPGIQVIGWPTEVLPEMEVRLAEDGLLPNRLIYDGYAAFQIAFSALGQTKEETTQNLANRSFETILGSIAFQDDGASTFNPYRLLRWDGQAFSQNPTEAATQ
ncbi:MAG: ABC transporter substrate-binding protein [Rhizobiaceae bacterium]|nr:ABC transporter substrate-binding protein [Rhizobiaceae bacterium]